MIKFRLAAFKELRKSVLKRIECLKNFNDSFFSIKNPDIEKSF